jgi:hypothetical protein
MSMKCPSFLTMQMQFAIILYINASISILDFFNHEKFQSTISQFFFFFQKWLTSHELESQ